MHRRRLLSIPPGAPFLSTFADALIAGRIVEGFPDRTDPLALAQARIFVPTRRAARALAAELSRALGAQVVILPEIVALGALDASEMALFGEAEPGELAPEAISEIERRLELARLILAWGRAVKHAIRYVDAGRVVTDADETLLVTSSPAQAFRMAGDLGALIDEFVIEGVERRALDNLVPDQFDKYWGITLDFLKIAFETWPQHLSERGLADRAERQAALVEAEIRRLREAPPRKAEIVLGSTGTNAATAKLMTCIASLPQGAVVLPGLHKELEEETWSMLAPVRPGGSQVQQAAGHEQTALFRLLHIMDAVRDDVESIGDVSEGVRSRIMLLREALLPAEATDRWPLWRAARGQEFLRSHGLEIKEDLAAGRWISAALGDVEYVDAPDERMEALAIAIVLREALEMPGRSAALITPDRALAHRVRAELMRWNIEVDDSGGDPLAECPSGLLAQIVLACGHQRAGSADILALINHAQVRAGYSDAAFAELRVQAETLALRGAVWNIDDPARSMAAAVKNADDSHAHRIKRNIAPAQWDRLGEFFARLADALQPLRLLRGEQPINVFMDAHRNVLTSLRAREEETDVQTGADELALQSLFDSFAAIPHQTLALSYDAYVALFGDLMQETVVRGARRNHPRLKILGLLEARLLDVDVAILGGLDETVWPPAARTDEFLNRPMRATLGLTSPERRIGQTAHDFVMASGARRVVFSRARKRGGSPTVPSRFIQRIEALAGEACWQACRERGQRLLDLAAMIDAPALVQPVQRPKPCPPVALRPKGLSITQIETWRRDPYAIYAQHILKLEPLDEPDPEDDNAGFGTRLHDVLALFQKACPEGPLPQDALQTLTLIGKESFSSSLLDPDFIAFRWPRLLRFFAEFVRWEDERRQTTSRIVVEQSGKLQVALKDETTFTLRGRADRFEFGPDGSVTIIDYKSGRAPSRPQVKTGLSPQLTLEAAMIMEGAFDCAQRGTVVHSACYVAVGKPGEVAALSALPEDEDITEVAKAHLLGLAKYASQFREEKTPYLSRPIPQFESRFNDYDHLARTSEWSAIDSDGSGGES